MGRINESLTGISKHTKTRGASHWQAPGLCLSAIKRGTNRYLITSALRCAYTTPSHIWRKLAPVRPDRQTCSEGKRTGKKNPWAWLFTTSTAQEMTSTMGDITIKMRELTQSFLPCHTHRKENVVRSRDGGRVKNYLAEHFFCRSLSWQKKNTKSAPTHSSLFESLSTCLRLMSNWDDTFQ